MKRVAIFVILAALTVGFSSCSAVRHCQAPEVEMPGQIASGYTDSLTIADLSWWQFYGDSTLRRVIELTLENNKDMLAAAARVEQMRQLYRISKAERLPNFSAKGLADYETNDYADEESSRDPEMCIRDRSGVQCQALRQLGAGPLGKPALGQAQGRGGVSLFGRGLACDAYDSRRGSCDGLFSVDGFG